MIKFTRIILFFALAMLNSNSVYAETLPSQSNLISQLRGYKTDSGVSQLRTFDYQIGTVIGIAGGIVTVQLENGTVFNSYGVGWSGDNVLVLEQNGKYSVVDVANPPWILELQEDYGVRPVE